MIQNKMNSKQIKQRLQDIAQSHPYIVHSHLKKGDTVKKSAGLKYEIDDVNIHKKLGNFENGVVPYTRIYHALLPSQSKINGIFNGSEQISFSRAMNAGIGECLEKSILVQLAAQGGRDSFLINGLVSEDHHFGIGYHAYNIVFKNENPFLVDAQIPRYIDGQRCEPFIVPVTAIEGEFILLPDELRLNRQYMLA